MLETPDDSWRSLEAWFAALLVLSGYFALLGAFGLVGYQILHWLRDGDWIQFTLFKALSQWFPSVISTWLIEPTRWIGLSRAVRFILGLPLLLFLVLSGLGLLAVGGILETIAAAHINERRLSRRNPDMNPS